MSFSLLSDAPADRDLLNFERYSGPLVSVLADPYLTTPLTIGIFGTWGTGKSTLMGLLEAALNNHPSQKFVCIRFNPWVHRKEANLLVPLLHALRDSLASRYRQSAEKIMDVLVRLGADLVLKHFTAGVVSLDKLEKYEKAYLERRAQSESQLRNLRQTLEQEAKKLAPVRLVFFIDDLDRCEPAEIMDLLEAVKLSSAEFLGRDLQRGGLLQGGETALCRVFTASRISEYAAKFEPRYLRLYPDLILLLENPYIASAMQESNNGFPEDLVCALTLGKQSGSRRLSMDLAVAIGGGSVNAALTRAFHEGLDRINLASLNPLRERELRDALHEWSPFEDGGLGTFDYLREIKKVDEAFLFLTQTVLYFERDLLDEPSFP